MLNVNVYLFVNMLNLQFGYSTQFLISIMLQLSNERGFMNVPFLTLLFSKQISASVDLCSLMEA